MRVAVEWRSASRENYRLFCKKFPSIKLTYVEWENIIYSFNDLFREHILETGNKEKIPMGLGEVTIIKKKRKKMKMVDGVEKINLPIDWKKTKEKGKVIYNFNYHTEGFFFGWHWFNLSARFKHSNLWFFRPCRVTSRLINHYIKVDDKYQHIYQEWQV
jgi:hypothetical protein